MMKFVKKPSVIITVLALAALMLWLLKGTFGCHTVTSVGTTTSTITTTTTAAPGTTTTTAAPGTTSTTATTTSTTTTIPEAAGVLDTSFGTGGMVVAANAAGGSWDEGKKVIVDGSEKPVVAGFSGGSHGSNAMAAWRYNTGGSPDTGFNGTGVVLKTDATPESEICYGTAVVEDGSGNLLVAGYCDRDESHRAPVVWKLTSSGALDTSFGNNGVLFMPAGSPGGQATGIALDGSGNIYLSCYVDAADDKYYDAVVVKLDSSGQPVTGYGSDGYAVIHNNNSGNAAYGLAVEAGGRVYLCGYGTDSNGMREFAVWRITAAGALDTSFGTQGSARLSLTDAGGWRAAALDDAGRILVVGSQASDALLLARYTGAGVLDTAFNTTGYARYSEYTYNIGRDLCYDGRFGKILVGGTVGSSKTELDLAVWRYTNAGQLDTTFSGDGVLVKSVNGEDYGQGVALDSSGRIYLTGVTVGTSGARQMVLIRVK